MASVLVVYFSLLTNTILFCLMFKGVYIPSGKTPFFIGIAFGLIYLLVGHLFNTDRSKRLNRMLIFSISLYIAFSLGGLVYYHWKMDYFISSLFMMKISLAAITAFLIYINVIYIRAEISYKRKRGNQRIQKESKKGQIDRWLEKKKEKEDSNEIIIILGNSTESEEQAPPI
ncbi:hypothetical protein WMZ97_16570 [Lentibacillus sp. N15]|uniref:hypothetical protein n=1 Tax=Lentibacillus songyuanensis TaxID=3136161 RepID=UPI0031BAFECA